MSCKNCGDMIGDGLTMPIHCENTEIEQGWHFCPEWDGLLVGEGMI